MNTSNFLKCAGAGAAAMVLTGASSRAAEPAVVPAATRPNFVVILIDDMGYGDIEPFGSKVNRTPNLNRMAAEGLKLTSFYAAPVCTPSRAQLMTGCYAKRVSMPNVIFPKCATGLNTEEKTVARLLRDQGYATMCIGKWHLGDQPEFLPTKHGFDHYVGLPYSNDMGKAPQPPLPLLQDEQVVEAPVEQDKLTRLYTEEAVKFITANAPTGAAPAKPFFLYFPHTAVHAPLHPGKAFSGKSANGKYGDWVEEVDWSVGQVLQALRDLKLESNTLVLITSDNGPCLAHGKDGGVAGPLRGGKGSCWEGGVREPTLAWWPGRIAAGSTSDAMTSELDVLPTLVKLAGGQVPADRKIDGLDAWPLLSGMSKESPHEALYYFNGNMLAGVRAGAWKLLIKPQGQGLPKGDKAENVGQLYNLDQDPGESVNVAEKHPEIVQRLQGLIQKMDADLGATQKGPGVRPCGKVKDPKPLTKDGREYT